MQMRVAIFYYKKPIIFVIELQSGNKLQPNYSQLSMHSLSFQSIDKTCFNATC